MVEANISLSKLIFLLKNNWPDGGWVGDYMIQELKQHLRRLHLILLSLHLNAEIIICVFICHIDVHYFWVGLDSRPISLKSTFFRA